MSRPNPNRQELVDYLIWHRDRLMSQDQGAEKKIVIDQGVTKQFWMMDFAWPRNEGGWAGFVSFFVWIIRGTPLTVTLTGEGTVYSLFDAAIRGLWIPGGKATYTEIQGRNTFPLAVSAVCNHGPDYVTQVPGPWI
jgi:hypothetical protein